MAYAFEECEKELEMMARIGNHPFIVQFHGAEISQIRKGVVPCLFILISFLSANLQFDNIY